MKRSELLDYLAGRINGLEQPHPVRVALDGPDAAGKTTLAQELSRVSGSTSPSAYRGSWRVS
jgi:uridine kinase